MRKTFIGIVSIVFLSGCVAAILPQYLSDKHPYKKEFFSDYAESVEAVKTALAELGWTIAGEGNLDVYERAVTPNDKSVIIFSEIRQTPMFLGSRYAKLNVIVRGIQNKTEIEIRYVTVTSLPFRNIQTYKNDATAQRIFEHIEKHLKAASSY